MWVYIFIFTCSIFDNFVSMKNWLVYTVSLMTLVTANWCTAEQYSWVGTLIAITSTCELTYAAPDREHSGTWWFR